MYKETTSENISRQKFLFQLELGVTYQESRKKNHVLKLSISLDSYIRKTCQVKYCQKNIIKVTKLRKSIRDAKNMCTTIVYLRIN